jgi:hypothetical protein
MDPLNSTVGRVATAIVAAATATISSAALAAPAAAQALSASRTCYVDANPATGAPVTLSGTGFTPGDSIEVEGHDVFGTTTAAPDGSFTAIVEGPTLSTAAPAAKRFTLTAHDETDGVTSAATQILVANLAFRTKPAVAKPWRIVTFHFSGFRRGRPIYAHFIHGKKIVVTHKYGRAKAPCGMLKTRTRLFPGGHPRLGHYKVQFDDSRRYRSKALPRIVTAISIHAS